jgi:hypothetical protein
MTSSSIKIVQDGKKEENPRSQQHTLDLDVWDRGLSVPLSIPETLANLHVFREVLGIEPTRGPSH